MYTTRICRYHQINCSSLLPVVIVFDSTSGDRARISLQRVIRARSTPWYVRLQLALEHEHETMIGFQVALKDKRQIYRFRVFSSTTAKLGSGHCKTGLLTTYLHVRLCPVYTLSCLRFKYANALLCFSSGASITLLG